MVLAMSEGIVGIQVTKVFGREAQELTRFSRRNLAVVDQQEHIFLRASRFTAAVHFVSQVNLAILLGYGGLLVARDALSLGGLVVFARVLQQFSQQVSAMAQVVNTLQQSLAGARRVFEVLDAPVEIDNPSPAVLAHSPAAAELRGELWLDQVEFTYPAGRQVLKGVSLRVPAGTSLGVMGATGAGKTTLLGLIPRFHDVTAGRVLVDGCDVRHFDVDRLRSSIGTVFQQTVLFKQSVADNIAFGHPGASRSLVEQAAQVAGADEFIRALPGGYDCLLAEEGMNLSGGQRQRLALARAVLVDPKLLVLDEPTSALDPRTESEVLSALRNIARGRTTVIVSSRLSTLRFVDRIVVIDQGQVVEEGTHAELMERGGIYRRTAELQGLSGSVNRPSPEPAAASMEQLV
jgi:ATP-binding cassette subfamily B protein